ncbi:17208_t:CDS:1, partial [Rhizophagus irregularis]
IENPQNKKQDFSRNLSERLKQTSQLNQEKNNPQEQLAQSEVDIQELKFQQGQYKSHQLTQSQINKKKIEDENISHFQVSQNEIEEMILTRQNQLEQNYQDLRFNSTAQIREFAEKENTLQSLITCLQNEKQALIEQKEQLENQLNQFRINYEQIEQEKIELHDMVKGLSQNQKLTIKLKAKLEKKIVQLEEKIVQLEQKLINEEQIKIILTYT